MKELDLEVKDRIISVDALRGLVMFIILSTQIGGAPIFRTFSNMVWDKNWPDFVTSQLTWNHPGPNFISIPQPIFLFIVGVVIPFSLSRRLLQGDKKKIYMHIIKRALILFLFGLIAGGKLLNMPAYNRTLANIPLYNNVLEYIGISYLVCAILVLNTGTKVQWIVTGGLMLLIWAIFLFIPAPGWQGDRYSPEMNIAIFIEKTVLGKHVSGFGSWTGVLNTIGHITEMLLGVLMGKIIFGNRSKSDKTKLLFISSIVMVAISKIWGIWYPVLGAHLTGPYVLLACGIATFLLALFYLIIDVWGYRKWAFFFVVFGANSIAIYMMAHLFDFRLIGNILVGGISSLFSPNVEAFIKAITAMAVMWLIMYYMYRKKTFIKV